MLDGFDIVLSPASGVTAFAADRSGVEALAGANCTSPLSAAGTPAAAINCGFTSEGKPIGLQIAATRFEDLRVLRATAWYEAHRGADATPDWSALP